MIRPSVLQQPVASSSTSHAPPSGRAQQPRYSPYTPSPHELHPGPRNRLFLALRSGLPSEVDWALPRLVAGSYDVLDHFKLETWIDSVGALQYWPERWVDGLEIVSASHAIRSGLPAPKAAQATVPEWTLDPAVEKRATESLLVLRNASFGLNNSKLICRATFLGLLDRFFALPLDFLVDVLASYPETVSHILTILANILPHLHPSAPVLAIFANVLPVLLVQTRDAAMIQLLLPILITTATLPNLPALPDDLVPHLLMLISTRPASPLLDLLLDALLTLSSLPAYSRLILSSPDLGRYLKTLVPILRHGATPYNAQWDSSHLLAGKTVRNPASSAGVAEAASQRRAAAREDAQARLDRGETVEAEVGDKMPALSDSIKAKLYAMPEPKRSIAWMHETFVYSSSSQLLQVTFWHAYRDFFTHPSTKEQLLSASEVIKNVTVAFPGASAKIWVDESGAQKFVIAGMGFRKGSDDDDRFACRWRDCTGSKHSSPASLLNHVTTHLLPPPTFCGWGSCPSLFSTTHVLTHIPSLKRPAIPEHITLHPSLPTNMAHSPRPTSLPPAPLPRSVKLAFTATRTDTDAQHKPAGPAFLTALILRHLARGLRLEVAVDAPEMIDREEAGAKRKHLVEERYGLPIPESVLKEEEEEERNASKDEEEGMSAKERLRAQRAFEGVEEALLRVMEENMSGLGMYLGETVGW